MEKQIISFSANEQILKKTAGQEFFADDVVGYIEAHFDLGDNWSGYDSIRAVWFTAFAQISTVLDQDGVCLVPPEVCNKKEVVNVNLVGSIVENNELTDRLTTYPIVAFIFDGNARVDGSETAPVTPSQFEQYVAIVEALVGSVKDIDHATLNADYTLTIYYSDGTSDTVGPIRGEQGPTGNGIASIAKTGTSGTNPVVDTYTITYTNGQTTTFTVTNGVKGDTGVGIQSIYKTGTVGNIDTYTILYTDGNTTTFTVANGEVTYAAMWAYVDPKIASLDKDLSTFTGNKSYPYTQYKYIALNGATADVAHPQDTSSMVECCVAPCSEGDVIHVHAVGAGNMTRAWAFVANDGTILDVAPATIITYNQYLTAPANTAYFVSNNYWGDIGHGYVYKNTALVETVKSTLKAVDRFYKEEQVCISAALSNPYYINSTTGQEASSGLWKSTDFVDISNARKLYLTMATFEYANVAGMAFYKSDHSYISGVAGRATGSASYEMVYIEVPSDAKYAKFSFRTSDASHFVVYADQKIRDTLYMGLQMFEKIGVIGDSIACGWALDKNGNRSRRNTGISWVQQMARRLGCSAYNLGASGVDPIEWFQADYEFYQYCYPYYVSTGACDLYIIGLGLNQGTLGSVADINQLDYTQNGSTFYGQYARIIQMINAEHPDAIVMCFTEPTSAISAYDQAVRNICALNYIKAELVDLERDYFDLFNTPEILAEHQPDGLHFTPYGYSLIAESMIIALNDFISKTTTDYKFVGVATA